MSSMHFDTLLYRVEQGVAWITLDRPSARNRVDLRSATELREVCRLLGQDDEIRAVVLTGAGEAFCAGDEAEPLAPDEGGPVEALKTHLEMRKVAVHLGAIEKPVVAAINGDALGHGLELALACDIRLAANGARMGMPQIQQGSMPWDGGTQRLPRLVGRAFAADLLLTGRVVEAAEALRIGLVHQVTPSDRLVERAAEVAAELASKAPIAARYVKESLLKGMDMTMEQGLRLEMDLNLILQTTDDRAEGLASFLERRPPHFTGT